jgi:hypothetical protein
VTYGESGNEANAMEWNGFLNMCASTNPVHSNLVHYRRWVSIRFFDIKSRSDAVLICELGNPSSLPADSCMSTGLGAALQGLLSSEVSARQRLGVFRAV